MIKYFTIIAINTARYLAGILLILTAGQTAQAVTYDLGIGWSAIDNHDTPHFDSGLDFQIGYEVSKHNGWKYGHQLHLINGSKTRRDITGNRDMSFDSIALYYTARPYKNSALKNLQLKAGIVQAEHLSLNGHQRRAGFAYGAGLVAATPRRDLRMHFFDIQYFMVGPERFMVYTLGITAALPGFLDI